MKCGICLLILFISQVVSREVVIRLKSQEVGVRGREDKSQEVGVGGREDKSQEVRVAGKRG